MKIQIDIDNKTITIDESVTMDELFTSIKKRLPNNSWKEYTLKTKLSRRFHNVGFNIDSTTLPCTPNVPNPNRKNITCNK